MEIIVAGQAGLALTTPKLSLASKFYRQELLALTKSSVNVGHQVSGETQKIVFLFNCFFMFWKTHINVIKSGKL